jgi:type II secretory ATPase GspE/PulE/Tfp pilus assembly ATPase PilB-like protein
MIENFIDFIQHSAPTFFSVIVARLVEKTCEKCKEEQEETVIEEQAPTEQDSDSETPLWDPKEENNI